MTVIRLICRLTPSFFVSSGVFRSLWMEDLPVDPGCPLPPTGRHRPGPVPHAPSPSHHNLLRLWKAKDRDRILASAPADLRHEEETLPPHDAGGRAQRQVPEMQRRAQGCTGVSNNHVSG